MNNTGIMEIKLSEGSNNFTVNIGDISKEAESATVKLMLWTSLEELYPLRSNDKI